MTLAGFRGRPSSRTVARPYEPSAVLTGSPRVQSREPDDLAAFAAQGLSDEAEGATRGDSPRSFVTSEQWAWGRSGSRWIRGPATLTEL